MSNRTMSVLVAGAFAAAVASLAAPAVNAQGMKPMGDTKSMGHEEMEKMMKENQAKLEQISGAKQQIAFGSQIRSYVLHPYQLVKDHRTKEQVSDVGRVLDGDIDVFIKTYLMKKSSGTLGQAAPEDDLD